MKILIALILALCAGRAPAQWIVNDPVNTAVNSAIQTAQAANQVETLQRWAEQLEKINRQIRQLEDQLATQRRIRDVLGDPAAAGVELMRGLGAEEFARTYGETTQAIRRLSDAVNSLRSTADGIYRQLDDRTVLGRSFTRQTTPYLRYAAVDQQARQAEAVLAATEPRIGQLQRELSDTLQELRTASTQAEVDKLSAKVNALNGQLALLAAHRRDEADKLQTAWILNENQAEKERLDLLEKQIAEEQQTLGVVNAWQSAIKLTPTSYTRTGTK
ncbi:MAG: type IV secretion system protein [Lacunisphaera sp.]|nr:type IV secretion system protein [Lacunisphaera sp.]